MINLQKNKCGGQDAHSALISDLKQVLAKYDVSEPYADSLCGMLPHRVAVGDVDLSAIESELIREIQESTLSVYNRKKAMEMSRQAFVKYRESFMESVNIFLHSMDLPTMHLRGQDNSDYRSYDYKEPRGNSGYSLGRTGAILYFENKFYTGEENPVFNPVRVLMYISVEVNNHSLMHDTFVINSVADVFTYGKAFFKMMCVARDVTDASVRRDLYDKFRNEHKSIIAAYKAANPDK